MHIVLMSLDVFVRDFICHSVSNKMFLERLFPLVLCLSIVHESAAEQSCDESLLVKNGKFSRSDVSGLITIDNKSQMKMCLAVLGNSPLDARIAELLWRDLVKVRTIIITNYDSPLDASF